ncbi:molybdopterin cofactor-binding domain-containing protein [Rhizobium herbae]|uniref:Xanthine dehydrogenase D subunit/xanthine dehydrogenase C subunit n=1 Tax=Rhizobium herbae TaxID=508661 RepID=A0ABS4EQQ4_9HYPH|nr:molybdopterin cofactor-binding domain-containing protein [Rhizobium herbae]MBP1860136.1 xanthine dehydrogenase D subunit/xanthine dehydrogenase C subunit [Rhizobium herbae]
MAASGFTVVRAASADEALSFAADPSSRLVAGATALQLEWAKGQPRPQRLIDLTRIVGLSSIEVGVDKVRIGALVPLAQLTRDAALAAALPLLTAVAKTVAGPAVRNLATVGGNIAGRTGCLLPSLLALDASLEIVTLEGRRTVSLAAWLAEDHSRPVVIETIIIPRPKPGCRWTQRKIGLRAAFTPSIIGISAVLDLDGDTIQAARLAVGGGSVMPARLLRTERMLANRPLAEVDWAGIHAGLLTEIAAPGDAFRSAAYRCHAAANALVYGLSGALPGDTQPGAVDMMHASGNPVAETLLSKAAYGDRWHVRPDGPAKVAGTFAYLTDHRTPDMLVGRILRAGIPHARILSIDTSAAEALPGVAAVVTHRDIPGDNAFGIVIQDQPAFCFDTVRYAGDAVAAVAAVDARTAERALALIRVDYAPLPVVTDPRTALLPDAQAVHDGGNLQCALSFSKGDIETGFAHAAHVIEATYETPRQMHGFMETEGGHAFVDEDEILTVCAGGQHGSRDRLQLSRILAMPEDRIRVVTSPTGGAFGGKDELTVQPALALLALKTGRRVRLQLDRAESVTAGTKRNPMTIRMRTACDREGMLLAQEVEVIGDAGAYVSLGAAVLETALEHACGPYVVAHVASSGRLAYTNNGVCGAFRGFGANQMTFAVECQMDRLAAVCGLDPLDMRRRNLRQPGMPGTLGQRVAPSERLAEMLTAAQADSLWRKPGGLSPDGSEVLGIGMALNYQGNGLGTLPPDPAGGGLRLAPDGMIEALYGLDEMGQGLLASVQAAVSSALGCARADIRAVTGDTAATPESGSTTASRGTYVVWKAAALAAPEFSQNILTGAAGVLKRPVSQLVLMAGGIGERGSNSGVPLLNFRQLADALGPDALPSVSTSFDFPKTEYQYGNARFLFAFGATLARVAVSRITGQVRVLDLVQHTAAGPVLDAAAYLGQIEGGGLQGLGFTLSEDAIMENGLFVTGNLDSYMLPGIADAPETLRVHALETLDADDPFGPRGVGELGIGAVTPAVANAVANAIGIWPVCTPFDPQMLLDTMEGRA